VNLKSRLNQSILVSGIETGGRRHPKISLVGNRPHVRIRS